MYTRAQKIITSTENLSNYIDGKDIYNSKLLAMLSDTSVDKIAYQITTYEYRPDLIAQEFYGSTSYSGFVILQAARGLEELKRGSYILLISKDDLTRIISNL